MHCEIGATQGPLGYVNALGATRLVHWLILVAPSCLRSHNARYIMLKSLSHYLKQCWPDSLMHMGGTRGRWVNWTIRTIFSEIWINIQTFCLRIAFENAIRKMMIILFRPQYFNLTNWFDLHLMYEMLLIFVAQIICLSVKCYMICHPSLMQFGWLAHHKVEIDVSYLAEWYNKNWHFR